MTPGTYRIGGHAANGSSCAPGFGARASNAMGPPHPLLMRRALRAAVARHPGVPLISRDAAEIREFAGEAPDEYPTPTLSHRGTTTFDRPQPTHRPEAPKPPYEGPPATLVGDTSQDASNDATASSPDPIAAQRRASVYGQAPRQRRRSGVPGAIAPGVASSPAHHRRLGQASEASMVPDPARSRRDSPVRKMLSGEGRAQRGFVRCSIGKPSEHKPTPPLCFERERARHVVVSGPLVARPSRCVCERISCSWKRGIPRCSPCP